ncbi:helix-turn-helix domain-containing protein [Amycolatopsis rhabdoformis]|uniref:Helix-turn-helix domain-containing protein n=1 Tax=Amycolatopsis rhabdoformis TaxID=1448059 RepID=A0ABZ1I1S3_9PSEU|nr:helix-turn-helix domain-containing protein [Amycolatopsis rhabdoformis]WSE27731.1 helix-turn-helix domain-containing protein [Amycolatopsis rhabdoformis]
MRRIPRGIVDEHVARTKFTLARHAPAPALAEFVDYHWVLRWDLDGHHDQHVLPNIAVHVTFFPGACGVSGPGHTLFTHRLTGRAHGLGVRFRPGCFRPFLGAPVRTLADRSAPLADVFGALGTEAAESVRNASADEEMIAAVDNLLIAKHAPLPPAARTAAAAVETIADDPEITRVDQLGAAAGLSARALQRLFAEHVGCTPKWAIRIYRLNDAARGLTDSRTPDYADLAARLGYSDQPHFTRDFRAVTGSSPGEFARSARRDPTS